MPPKKPGVYDADIDDCRTFFDSWLAQVASSVAGWDGYDVPATDGAPTELAAAVAAAVDAPCASEVAPDSANGLFPAVADGLFTSECTEWGAMRGAAGVVWVGAMRVGLTEAPSTWR